MIYAIDSTPRRMSEDPPSYTCWHRLPDSVDFGTVSAVHPADGSDPLAAAGTAATQRRRARDRGDLVFFGDEDGWLSTLEARTGRPAGATGWTSGR
jgi:hypothetical protein